ncbi:MAG: TonB-dependent receptor [Alistipes sp.]|nr:TonB-dependent receptor [Alistipes sp.]
MKDIGVQKTELDSVVLRENVALSMADILTFNSSIFVKQYGRATLSTVAFRGTSASHTQVTWNGMKINSPMLGMTDFSMIPSYFIDDAALLHGTSSVNETGGGLGGAVKLSTRPADADGFGLQFVQGAGSFMTFDEFLRLTYGDSHWQVSARAVYSNSRNDFRYTNYNKKENVYDDEHNIIATYYPVERNKNGAFRDLHILPEVYYNTGRGDRFGLQAWYLDSKRGLPMLSVDHREESDYRNEQRERTFRGILSWKRIRGDYKLGVSGGYVHTAQAYDFERSLGNGNMATMIASRSKVNTVYGRADAEYVVRDKWLFTADLSAHQHFVESADRNVLDLNSQSLAQGNGKRVVVGYMKARIELSAGVSAKWMPTERLGFSAVIREEMYGDKFSPVIPAFFADYKLSKRGNVMLKASVSRNYRFPSLNDLYFLPGGNPDLKPEHGFTYDAGISFATGREGLFALSGGATWFDSYIDDWIVWLPTAKGFWTPKNIKSVHAYGVELKLNTDIRLARDWQLGGDAAFSWTPSINNGDPADWADRAIGKQLVYVPLYSASATGRLTFRSWRLIYKWCWYSERFTTSDNNMKSRITRVLPYFMNDVSLEKAFSFSWSDLSIKAAVKNLLNEEYESVLSRPMPRMNFEIFLEIKPKFKQRKTDR